MITQIYLDGYTPGTYRGYETVIEYGVRCKIPGYHKLVKEVWKVRQICEHRGIDIADVELVTVVVTKQGEFELSSVNIEPKD